MQNTNDDAPQPQSPQDLLDQAPVAEMASNEGALLRTAREAKRLSAGDVAYSLKVSPRVIEALEAGEWDKLPGRTFVVGTLRAYGRLLEISVDTLVATVPGAPVAVKKTAGAAASAKSATAKPSPKAEANSSRARETKHQSHRMLKFGLVMILLAVVLAYAVPRETIESALQDAQSMVQRLMGSKPAEPSDIQAQSVPAAENGAAPAAAEQQAQTGTGTLELRFAAPAWVEVRDHTGRIIYSQLNAAGTTQFITGAAPLDVMIGNAKQVQARWRDEPVKLDKLSGDDVARQTLR